MTRINLVDPSMLSDKHLTGEYREITRPFNKVYKHILKGRDASYILRNTGDEYTLNTGHESFFFDKLQWLYYRWHLLRDEMLKRGINVDQKKFDRIACIIFNRLYSTEYWNWYTPQPHEIYLNFARMCRRSGMSKVLEELESEK